MSDLIKITIDDNVFEFENDQLYINKIKASDDEAENFFPTLKIASDGDFFDTYIFFENYDIIDLNKTKYFDKYYIVEIKTGSCFVKSIWSKNSVQEIKDTLNTAHNGGEWLANKASLRDHLDFYIDGNYQFFTKKEFIEFIINRQDTHNLKHDSVISYINHKL